MLKVSLVLLTKSKHLELPGLKSTESCKLPQLLLAKLYRCMYKNPGRNCRIRVISSPLYYLETEDQRNQHEGNPFRLTQNARVNPRGLPERRQQFNFRNFPDLSVPLPF